MKLSVEKCIEKLKREHPDLYPIWYVEHGRKVLVNMLRKSDDPEEALANIFAIDPNTGVSTGSLPIFALYSDDALAEKLNNPTSIEHGVLKKTVSSSPDELIHYGIKGQRWGVRRWQNEDGSRTPEGKIRYGQGDGSSKKGQEKTPTKAESAVSGVNKKPTYTEIVQNNRARTAEAWYKEMEKTNLSDLYDRETTKKGDNSEVAVHVINTVLNPLNVLTLGVRATQTAIANSKVKSFMKKREQLDDVDPKTGLYLKHEGQYTEKEDLAAVNPGFKNMNSNTKNNCMLCTTTYDLRQRGYDVTARLDSIGYNMKDLKRWYPNAKMERTSRFGEDGKGISQKEYVARSINNLLKQGDGARGNMMVLFTTGGAHSIVYEVRNGSVVFKDGQANVVYRSPEKVLNVTTGNAYARLDNIKPDYKKIKQECCR